MKINRLYQKLVHLGIGSKTPNDKILRTKIINGIALITGFVMLTTSIFVVILLWSKGVYNTDHLFDFFSNGNILLALKERLTIIFPLFDFISAIICFIVIILNYHKRYNSAAYLLIFFSIFVVVFFYWFRGLLSSFFFFIPIMFSVVFLDRKKEYIPIVITTLLLMVVLSIIKYDHGTGDLFTLENSRTSALTIYLLNFFVSCVIIFMVAFHFKRENTKYEMHLKETNKILQSQAEEIRAQNEEILAQNEEITAQRDEIVHQKDVIESRNQKITDSISYALRIQSALLPDKEDIEGLFDEYFIVYKPKDIVSGDFYIIRKVNQYILIALADCTGHGVPGAMMSMLGFSFLNEIIVKENITTASQVLDELRRYIVDFLHQERKRAGLNASANFGVRDGIDISFVAIDTNTNTLQYSGANSPLYIAKYNGSTDDSVWVDPPSSYTFVEVFHDRMPVGICGNMVPFTNHTVQLRKGDIIYLASDGYADQFGGANGKKFMAESFRQLIRTNCAKLLAEQQSILENTIENWKNAFNTNRYDQTDDITVLGVKIK